MAAKNTKRGLGKGLDSLIPMRPDSSGTVSTEPQRKQKRF